ncbi:MAG: hypothetical protein A2283_20905 [Lentisphaerae bacterium RIFOXYA12_FULL_48_11]|nr:MAG: hypothetical protein A2283_20905 [Lentisphaerae bacterium RIFOXYA12_FULL_48_11]
MFALAALLGCISVDRPCASSGKLELIQADKGASYFVGAETGRKFVVWGVNYDHDRSGRLLEDYWSSEWGTVEEDFKEIKDLGANVVRIHLQLVKFMKTPQEPDKSSLKQLARLLRLAEKTGLYLDVTGLGCYHKKDVPVWYDSMTEVERWNVQVLFWEQVTKTCSESPAIFCYDLMNEPVLPGQKTEKDWLGKPLGDKCFVQRISLDLAGRTREQVARSWVEKLVSAIRTHDKRHMITVGEIPWGLAFPGAKPLFSSNEIGAKLDFCSVHFYPKKGEVQKALDVLKMYDTIKKPIVVEEIFPLACGVEELDLFIEGSRGFCDGWIGFYWGRTIEEYSKPVNIGEAITKVWLEYFKNKTTVIPGR